MEERFRRVKDEVRILGVDDGPHKRTDKDVLVVGVVFRGGRFMDGVLSMRTAVDGLDATENLVKMVSMCHFKDLRVVMTDGISLGGFNVIDLPTLTEATGLPAISIMREMPDYDAVKKALSYLPDADKRWRTIQSAGKPRPVETQKGKQIYAQAVGIKWEDAVRVVKVSATHSLLPEPIRAAHLIARGVTLGESRGRA
ncbi:Uncharacterised protein [uncultured archaeon]|nr:Uncharacterised protein [uncultured archaeon]